MPQPRKAGRFGGDAAHHDRILANLATELIRHGRVRTTHAKAKAAQPVAERMVTYAKRGDLHNRRLARKTIRDADVLHHLFAEVGPAFQQRQGGYTRVLKLGPRKGDAAPMALLELVEDVGGRGAAEAEEAGRRRWGLRRQQRGEAGRQAVEAESPEDVAQGADEAALAEADDADEGAEASADDAAEADTDAAAEASGEESGDAEDEDAEDDGDARA